MSSPPDDHDSPPSVAQIVPRGLFGGLLMGLANLVPGISGGTMLLAVGIYERFIEAVASATSLRLDRPTLLTLGSVGAAGAAAIVLLAGPVKDLVVGYRFIMYSLFIGLTLGGVPVILALVREDLRNCPGQVGAGAVKAGAAAGFVAMAALAWVQMQGAGAVASEGWLVFFVGGLAGAAAMILPGVSGGYLLLVLGAYVPILGGIDAFREALAARDVGALVAVGFGVILPLGLGVLVGIAVVSHVLRWLFHRYRLTTLGVLLGLLVGAVAGLWPFQESRLPEPGESIKGQAVEVVDAPQRVVRFVATGELVDQEDLPTAFFTPTASQGVLALLLVAAGYGCTALIGRLGRSPGRA
jgi:putative membrane protein